MADRWAALQQEVATDDELPERLCGSWTEHKLWFWNRYIEITTAAMADKPQWRGLTYIDLFAGPGVCVIKDTGKRLPGSPLIAARAPKPFTKRIMVEQEETLAAACEKRLTQIIDADRFAVLRGDCNELASHVARDIPHRSLTLAFIDPEGLDVRFSTLETLATDRRVDFVMLWADAVDLVRNVDAYEQDPESKLWLAFGDDSLWKEGWSNLANRTGPNVRAFFAQAFQAAIEKRLGYAGVRQKIVRGPRGPLYRLLVASKHQRGLEFWDKVTARESGGQSEFQF